MSRMQNERGNGSPGRVQQHSAIEGREGVLVKRFRCPRCGNELVEPNSCAFCGHSFEEALLAGRKPEWDEISFDKEPASYLPARPGVHAALRVPTTESDRESGT